LTPQSPVGQPAQERHSIHVTFTCKDFGKTAKGVLNVWTSEGQFTYAIVGRQPDYSPPDTVSRVSARLDPQVEKAMLERKKLTNHIRRNMLAAKRGS
jgi:hypothetical protein